MYDGLLNLPPEKIDVIVNDFKSFEKRKNLSNQKIIEILKNKKVNFKLFRVYKNSNINNYKYWRNFRI